VEFFDRLGEDDQIERTETLEEHEIIAIPGIQSRANLSRAERQQAIVDETRKLVP
jgi:hypothetical protein